MNASKNKINVYNLLVRDSRLLMSHISISSKYYNIFPLFFSETRCKSRESAKAVQGRLRDPEGDWSWCVWRGMCRQAQVDGPRFRAKNPQQMGDVEASGDGLLPGREGRSGMGRQEVDHEPALRVSG